MGRPAAYRGSCFALLYAECADGSYPAKEFYDELALSTKQRFAVCFKRLGDTGKLFNKEKFKLVEGTSFYEFKSHRYRLFCRFIDGGIVLLTNGCEKKKDRLDPEQIRRAERIYEEDQIIYAPPKSRKGH